MQDVDISLIRKIDLFAGMVDEGLEDLLQMAYLQWFPPHLQIITEGDSADFLYVVVEGTVELFTHANGREATMGLMRPISVFALPAVLEGAVYLVSARTLARSQILMIPGENVHATMENNIPFARSMVRELANVYGSLIKAHKELKLRNGVERLANYLLRAHDQSGATGQIELTEDKRTLAAVLAMTPENLSRAFSALRDYGVDVHGSKIDLLALDELIAFAKPTHLLDDRPI